MLKEESEEIIGNKGNLDYLDDDIQQFNKMKQNQGVKEDQWDIGWFEKDNQLFKMDFEEEKVNLLNDDSIFDPDSPE